MLLAVEVNLGFGELLLYGIPFAIIVGWLSGRMLGVRRGWVRAFISGFIGWVVGVIIAALILDRDVRTTADLREVFFLAVFFGALVSMFVSLVFDIILRPREQSLGAGLVRSSTRSRR